MANFPTLSPGSRVFSPGSYAQAAYQSVSGVRTNVAHSNAMISSRLELAFQALTAAEVQSIFQHYHGQQGGFLPFRVPAEVFAGFPELGVGADIGSAGYPILDATYSQSSIYYENTAATAAGMTNGTHSETSQTGTDSDVPGWVRMDFGSVRLLTKVIVGCDFDYELVGDWGPEYTENRNVQGSIDGSTWTTLFNTGTFNNPIQEYSVNAAARYVRIISGNNYWLAVTEFYAYATHAFSDHLWRYIDAPQVEEIPTDPTSGVAYNVRVVLETAPAGGAIVAGATLGVALSLTAGAATASSSVAGADLTLTLSLEAGAASGS